MTDEHDAISGRRGLPNGNHVPRDEARPEARTEAIGLRGAGLTLWRYEGESLSDFEIMKRSSEPNQG
jgi:hypothetical protein